MKEKICKFRKFAKKLRFFQKICMLFYFLPYRYYTIFFVIFKNLPPKEIFALKFFFCKNKIFNLLPIEVLLQCFELFYFS